MANSGHFFRKLQLEAQLQVGSIWTPIHEILLEVKADPDWLKKYGYEEIQMRDAVIARLMEERP